MPEQESSQPPAIPAARQSRKKTRDSFAPCFKVTVPRQSPVLIPIDKLSSDNLRQLILAKARDLLERQMERLANATLTPAEIRDLMRAVAELDALTREHYVARLNNAGSTSLGKHLSEIVRGAAEGAAAGASGFMDKMREMDKAAKAVKVQQAEVIDVKPA